MRLMFYLKKLLFKFMELGLGLRTCFRLETKNPIFINFKLSEEEAARVQTSLPPGITLQKIRFADRDREASYWVSYNLYEISYSKKELRNIRKTRCEINTFVKDSVGRKGVYVFCGSPYVSKETKPSLMGWICDLAERAVMFIYGCGKLSPLVYGLSESMLTITLQEGPNSLMLAHKLCEPAVPEEKLSDDYALFNDISFFNEARTFDEVNVNSAFYSAKFFKIEAVALTECPIKGPFFHRPPDAIYYHRGEIAYVVNAMNRLSLSPGVAG